MRFDFLLCSERSGSHLITRLVNAHSQVCGPATTHLFRLLSENVERYGDLSVDANWNALLQDALDLLEAKLGDWCTQWSLGELRRQVESRSLESLLQHIHRVEAIANGKGQLFIKEIEVFRYSSFLDQGFPEARYVYMVRDPRDMAFSWKRSAAIRGGVVRAAHAWLRDQTHFMTMADQLRPERRVWQTTYESLVTRPTQVLREVMKFLGVEFEPQQLTFYQQSDTHQIANAAADFANLRQPVMQDNRQKYRVGLTEAEVAYIEAKCGAVMERLGYVRELNDGRSADELERLLLPREPYEKLAYERVTPEERATRSRWVRVSERIRNRVPIQMTTDVVASTAIQTSR